MSSRGDRWERDHLDRDRFAGERDEIRERDRFEEDRVLMSGGRGRDRSEERLGSRYGRTSYEDDIVRDRRYYEDDIRLDRRPEPRREPLRDPLRDPLREPPREPPREPLERRVFVEKERDREYYRDSSPRRPTLLRRQSSLDTYDRRPLPKFFNQREELPPPARREDILREDYRAPAYTPIPLPKARGLPPPRRYDDRFYEDIKVEHDRIEEGALAIPAAPVIPPERIVEREIIREKEKEKEKRSRSRDSRSTKRSHSHKRSHRGRSHASKSSTRSSSSSSSSSSSGGTTVKSTKSEYPKKGKTRIPARLVSKRALIDIGYPFIEEGNVIVVQKALGQANIDHLLKLSEEYKSSELEVAAARSSAGEIIRERREELIIEAPAPPQTIYAPQPPQTVYAPPPGPPPAHILVPAHHAPVIIEAAPRGGVELIEKAVYRDDKTVYHDDKTVYRDDRTVIYRDYSPSSRGRRSRSRSHSLHHRHLSDDYQLVERHHSRSRSRKNIRSEIKALEKELAYRGKRDIDREIVRSERLPNGDLVVYEESIEKISSHKPARIEKDKKGRMSISVPKYR